MTKSAFLVAEICIKCETGNSINTAGGKLKSKLPTEGTAALISVSASCAGSPEQGAGTPSPSLLVPALRAKTILHLCIYLLGQRDFLKTAFFASVCSSPWKRGEACHRGLRGPVLAGSPARPHASRGPAAQTCRR